MPEKEKVDAFSSSTFTVTLLLPNEGLTGGLINITVSVASQDSALVQDIALGIDVKKIYGMELECLSDQAAIYPGESAMFNISITNLGNCPDVYQIDYASESMWNIELSQAELNLATGEKKNIAVTITSLSDQPGVYGFNIDAYSKSDSSIKDKLELMVFVNQIYDLDLITTDESFQVKPSATVELHFQLINTGTGNDQFDISILPELEDWSIEIESRIELDSGKSYDGTVQITIPKEMEEFETFEFTLTVVSKGDASVSEILTYEISVEKNESTETDDDINIDNTEQSRSAGVDSSYLIFGIIIFIIVLISIIVIVIFVRRSAKGQNKKDSDQVLIPEPEQASGPINDSDQVLPGPQQTSDPMDDSDQVLIPEPQQTSKPQQISDPIDDSDQELIPPIEQLTDDVEETFDPMDDSDQELFEIE